jgi:hypothetical protein
MAIGTWKLNAEKKKDYINAGHLSRYEKERMANVINDVWDKACRGKYTNREGKGPSVGMFGTGFYSFVNKTDSESCQRFIRMMVDISNMTDDYDMYNQQMLHDYNMYMQNQRYLNELKNIEEPQNYLYQNYNY